MPSAVEVNDNIKSVKKSQFKYGTAGFRMQASLLEEVSGRMGLFAATISQCLGEAVGLMITASHNPEPDNGLKLVGPDGAMAPMAWEALAESFVNASEEDLHLITNQIRDQLSNQFRNGQGVIIVGRDTRASGRLLLDLIKKSAPSDCKIIDLGLVTTPQLHYAVYAYNKLGIENNELLNAYFKEFMYPISKTKTREAKPLIIDFANGVGSKVKNHLSSFFKIQGINEGDGPLNEGCGADFVKSKKALPKNALSVKNSSAESIVGYSFDGDADRLIGYFQKGAELVLLDGDRIAALLATFLKRELISHDLKMAVVHTAYSNGAFVEYCQKVLGVPTECVPTGVKHLHHAASKYDVGIYFEANGHGTVLFSDKINWTVYPKVDLLKKCMNQLVGDAMSDLLAVEYALEQLNWSYDDWAGIYKERANELYKINVQDRSMYKTTPSEERLVQPEGLQSQIDAAVALYPDSRAFVRPSGTENILRLYVEGSDNEKVEMLAKEIMKLFVEK